MNNCAADCCPNSELINKLLKKHKIDNVVPTTVEDRYEDSLEQLPANGNGGCDKIECIKLYYKHENMVDENRQSNDIY